MADTRTNIVFGDIEIPTSQHPEIKKLKRKNNVHHMHGNKVWNSTLVTMDTFEELDSIKGRIADLGCGWGVLTHYMQKKGGDVTGFDLDEGVKPYFDLMSKLMGVKPKFKNIDIFSDDLPLDYDVYIACDVCFWEVHTDKWVSLIKKLYDADKVLTMIDPGRQSFWSLLQNSPCEYMVERRYIEKPRKTDAFIAMFGD